MAGEGRIRGGMGHDDVQWRLCWSGGKKVEESAIFRAA